MSNLYDNIQSLCRQKGISISGLCIEIGTSKSVMSDLKSGKKKTLSAATLAKIADYFGVTVDHLLDNTTPISEEVLNTELLEFLTGHSRTVVKILQAYSEASPKERDDAYALLTAVRERDNS